MSDKKISKAFKAALPNTIPILAGYIFLGIAYGVYMVTSGFSPIYPIIMSIIVFSGTIQFVAVGVMLSSFDPIGALIIALMVGARHLFYGISMLDRFKDAGWKKFFLIFLMSDETFSVECTIEPSKDVDKNWFMFFISVLDWSYWVIGTILGAICGMLITFNTEGIDFVMTALIVVLFLDQMMKSGSKITGLIGVGVSVICLAIFGADNFIIPSMIGIILLLSLFRKRITRHVPSQLELGNKSVRSSCQIKDLERHH